MDITCPDEGEQARLWNGRAARGWVEMQDVLDRLLAPFERMLVDAAPARGPGRVLDVGCGTGSTTLAMARLTAGARCVGVDISGPMIALARERAGREDSPAEFIVADAQVHAFEQAGFDRIVSRFGVMFFDDPVRAFANLRRAASDDAALHLIAWRGADENPFMTTAERAAAPLLPDLPARRPDAPGQFAFADAAKVRAILQQGGWTGIEIEPVDVECTLPEADLVRYLSWLGPVGLLLQDAGDATRARVMQVVRAAFDPYVADGVARFDAACWQVRAHAGMSALR